VNLIGRATVDFKNAKRLAAFAAAASLLALAPANAQDERRHALTLIDPPKFGKDFKHFDWVNPDAPKGGRIRMYREGTFDNLNPFTIKGATASGMMLVFDQLMISSPDEPSVEYCLVCEWVSHPDDFSSVTFKLRPEARFHDGKPITVEDVIFSLEAQKKANPRIAAYYKNVVAAEKTGDSEVTFRFDIKGNRELPLIVGQLSILPKHFWEGKAADGSARDITTILREPPLGSGPYKVGAFDMGRSLTYERVADWWAKDLPVARGTYNFGQITFDYFRGRTAAFESFKAGELDFWAENTAKSWATDYDFQAVKDGRVKLERIKTETVAPMQGFALNLRRPQFQDPRVRRAFVLAFNFEAINETLLYNQYFRTDSYFDNSELAATGLPEGRELEFLNEVKEQVPPEVFTEEYKNPVGGSDRDHRRNLAAAFKLLQEAGWKRDGRVLRNAQGETLKVEFLLGSPTFERHTQRYLADLKRLGIDASIRIVDTAQYQRRLTSFDYDVTPVGFGQSLSPGNEQRFYWGSEAADQPGSRNAMGIKNPAIDKLIDRIILAESRADLIAATRALDRVLIWNFYIVPLWHYPYERYAYWDKFDHPDKTPSQTPAVLQSWWVDPAKEKALANAN
jgi:microcin C transport system substrate-binding protein